MSFAARITFAVVISLIFHLILVGAFYYFHLESKNLASWSGGLGDGQYQVSYVDLGTFDVVQKASNENSVKIKSSKKLDSKTAQPKQNLSSPKKSGIGSSDTPAGGVGPGLDPGGTNSQNAPNNLALIRKTILQKKTYPLLAKDNGWSGQVKLSFKINQSGGLDFVQILKSSGYKILDEAAVQTIKKASPFPYYPKVIALSLEYRLE